MSIKINLLFLKSAPTRLVIVEKKLSAGPQLLKSFVLSNITWNILSQSGYLVLWEAILQMRKKTVINNCIWVDTWRVSK